MNIRAEDVVETLKERRLKLAVAESCTGGFLAKVITDTAGSSSVFDCGIVAYSNDIKKRLLNVNEADLEKYGAVSGPVARGMAEGVRKLAKAQIAVGISGIAGPDSDNTKKPVGLIYIALAYEGGCIVNEYQTAFSEDVRERNRSFAVANALEMIREYLRKS